MTETEYFLDYERRALNTSLDEEHVDVEDIHESNDNTVESNESNGHHDEELDSEDLLLPWSCCVANFLAAEEEKERQLNEPEALANTIRGRLLAKSQVKHLMEVNGLGNSSKH